MMLGFLQRGILVLGIAALATFPAAAQTSDIQQTSTPR